ncbi:lipoprotein N-acyltransferase Lnb domain-containing protein [Flavobacterium psychrotrophum]|uniref:lipoprotein N-acyltransferase Lnb domain-containing protein n=1 Tax=Flavobacterium psychrotrophum TaxID=2294119 RepID=UPI000E31CB70|nr:DUF4105 domain-containing protein [Flavobacterium psychrotrophum]
MQTISRLRLLLVFLLLAMSNYVQSQTTLSDRSFISLITCGPGNELYSVFGHTGIRVADPATGMDVVYNYGMFNFDTPNFYTKFVKGDLQYYAAVNSYADFVYTYQYYNRDVLEQKLNFTRQQKQQIADKLATDIVSDSKYYTYKYFERNCTTMVADIINAHLPVKISSKNEDEGKTYRKIVVERLHNSFYENLGISLIFGYRTDSTLHNLFLPIQLLQGIENTKLADGSPLSGPVQTIHKSTAEPETSIWNNFYTFIAACLILMAISNNIVIRRSLYAIFGLLGIFFSVVGLYSFHTEISQNYNVLLVNPLMLVLLYFSFAKNKRATQIIAIVLLALVFIYIIFMLNKPHLFIVLPLVALIAVMLFREAIPVIKKSSWRRGK